MFSSARVISDILEIKEYYYNHKSYIESVIGCL